MSIHCFRNYHNLDKVNLTTIVETTIVETGFRGGPGPAVGAAGLHPGTAAAAAAAAASSSGQQQRPAA